MKAWIISIGNELLLGRIVNTNASWLAKKLTQLGIRVRRIVTVPDDMNDVIEVFRDAISRADIVVSTGGLGPTYDDITNFALAKALNKEIEINQEALNEITSKYRKAGLPLTEERIKMSKMPKGAISLHNPVGIAPGIMVKTNGKLIFALPGVPSEMKAIFEEEIEKYLINISRDRFIEREIVVEGVPESTIAPIITEISKRYPEIYIKSHPQGKELEKPIIKMYIMGIRREKTEKEINEIINFITSEIIRLGGKIVG